jgi:hypothetical protein
MHKKIETSSELDDLVDLDQTDHVTKDLTYLFLAAMNDWPTTDLTNIQEFINSVENYFGSPLTIDKISIKEFNANNAWQVEAGASLTELIDTSIKFCDQSDFRLIVESILTYYETIGNVNYKTSTIQNDVQDRNSEAWKKLCEYVDLVSEKEIDEFSPREFLGNELFSEIFTLPESIGKLKKVKKIWLYGSNLKRIPPEIGEMESLEYFDPYTSYDLHWFPYELSNCKRLRDSRISTRTLYGNYKNRLNFPDLTNNPVRYEGQTVKCSVCSKDMSYDQTNQLWITLELGTDTVPLLANLCSSDCENKLPMSPKGYVQYPHKGGQDLNQPTYKEWEDEHVVTMTMEEFESEMKKNKTEQSEKPTLLKLIRKIWER